MSFHRLTRSSVSHSNHFSPTTKITSYIPSVCKLTPTNAYKVKHQSRAARYSGHKYYKTAALKQLYPQSKNIPKQTQTTDDFQVLNLKQANMSKLAQLKQKIFPLFSKLRLGVSRQTQIETPVLQVLKKKSLSKVRSYQFKFPTEPNEIIQKNVLVRPQTHKRINLKNMDKKIQKTSRNRQPSDFACNRWQVDTQDIELWTRGMDF